MSPEGLNRRNFLRVTSAAGLAALAKVAGVQADLRSNIRPLIIFFQGGAQSPYEFTTPLSSSPVEFRGPYKSLQTKHGIRISEAFPKFAGIAHQTSIVRSVDCENTAHSARRLTQGRLLESGTKIARGGIPYAMVDVPSTFSPHASLDPSDSFLISWNKKQKCYALPDLEPDPALRQRFRLLDDMDRISAESRPMRIMQENRELARSILLGDGKLQKALQVDPKQLERYGNNPIGMAAALATNMVRGGAGLVLIHNEGRLDDTDHSGWDMHDNIKKRTDRLAPATDQALVALAEDCLAEKRPMAVFTEHGRTPRINNSAGRDHHNVGYLVGVGGRFQEEVVFGSVDKKGDIANDRVPAAEVLPTMLAAAGVELDPATPRISAILKMR